MRIRFAEAANDELNEACDWFERQHSGPGQRFRRDVGGAARLIDPETLKVRQIIRCATSQNIRFVKSDGVQIGYVSASVSKSRSPVTKQSALLANKVANTILSFVSRGTWAWVPCISAISASNRNRLKYRPMVSWFQSSRLRILG